MSCSIRFQTLVPPQQSISISSLEELLAHRDSIPNWIQYWDECRLRAEHEIEVIRGFIKVLNNQTGHTAFNVCGWFNYANRHIFIRMDETDIPESLARLKAKQACLVKNRRRYASQSQRLQHVLTEN